MASTPLLPALVIAFALALLVAALVAAVQPGRARSLANLHRGDVIAAPELATRSTAAAATARRLTPAPIVTFLERQHARAGRPAQWPLDRLLVMKAIWLPVATGFSVMSALAGAEGGLVLLLIVGTVLVYFLPDLLLLSRGMERDQQIEVELADTLDQMTIAVEAGLAFDAAMSRAAANGKGAMAEELTRTLQDMRMGQARRQAFADLAARTQVADLRQFVRAVMQADANGISVGDVLRSQAAEMRLKRRQRAEAKAQQVPVKVVMPLILCILPTLFIVIIGPAALSMIETFSALE